MFDISVVHLLGALRPSGMERMFVSGADAFRAQQIHCHVVGQGASHPFRSEIEDAGIDVAVIDPVTTLRGAADWMRLLRDASPDIVHLHAEATYAPAATLSKVALPRAKVVRTVHSIFKYQGRRGSRHRLSNSVGDFFASALMAPTVEVAANESWRRLPVDVVSNWADRKYAEHLENDVAVNGRNTALIVGNCSAIKNHEVALKAIQETGWSVAHLGDESLASPTELRILAELAEDGKLHLRGVMDPLKAMAESSLFLMPSLHEGMGVSLLEALTYGLPALISDAPGLQWATRLPGVRVVKAGESWADSLRLGVPEGASPSTLFTAEASVPLIRRVYEECLQNR